MGVLGKMAYGVLPPLSGLVACEAFLEELCALEVACSPREGQWYRLDPYAFANSLSNEDFSEPLIDGDLHILGSAANALVVPNAVVNDYLHAVRIAQGMVYSYGWPELLGKGECDYETRLVIALLLGVMLDAEGAVACVSHLQHCLAFSNDDSWRIEVVGVLYPRILQVEDELGDVLKSNCSDGRTCFVDFDGAMRLLQLLESTRLDRAPV